MKKNSTETKGVTSSSPLRFIIVTKQRCCLVFWCCNVLLNSSSGSNNNMEMEVLYAVERKSMSGVPMCSISVHMK